MKHTFLDIEADDSCAGQTRCRSVSDSLCASSSAFSYFRLDTQNDTKLVTGPILLGCQRPCCPSSNAASYDPKAGLEPGPTLLRCQRHCCLSKDADAVTTPTAKKERCLPTPPSPSTSSSSSRRIGRRQMKLREGTHIGVISTGCTRESCRVESKQNGAPYQKCHCVVKQVNGDELLIGYVNNELDDEWISVDDKRLVFDKDEHWCAHGRVCNHVIRGKTCKRYGVVGGCFFCHNGVCAAGRFIKSTE